MMYPDVGTIGAERILLQHTRHTGVCLLVLCLLTWRVTAAPAPAPAPVTCPTGRFYLGDLNGTQTGQVRSTGVYVQVPGMDAAHRPVYRHTSRHLHLFFTRTEMEAFWIVAPDVTSNLSDVTIRMASESSQPITAADTNWQVKMRSGVWETVPKLRTVCVKEDFGPCTSGKINVTGITSQASQARFMGAYSLHNISQSLRPIYAKDGGPEVLYYGMHGLWVFSREIGSNSIDIFTRNSALLPEFILEPWIYFNGFGLRTLYISISCLEPAASSDLFATELASKGCPPSSQDPASHQSPETTSDQPTPAADPSLDNNLPTVVSDPTSPSIEVPSGCYQGALVCQNGGAVVVTGSGKLRQVACHCSGTFYGAHCELENRCGSVPTVAMATLQEFATEGMVVMAIYKCDVGYHSNDGDVAVCGTAGEWLYTPVCVADLFAGYDWSEVGP